MEIKIRKMDLSDISYVFNEEIKIFGKSLGEKTLYNEIMYNDMSRYFIAIVDGKRAGYVGSWLTIPNAEILNLLSLGTVSRIKIGKLLMEEVMKVCRLSRLENLTLEVRKSNAYAIALYKGLGFTLGTVRKNYYSNGEDALLLVLNLGVE